jgi:quinoprotein glucose dehydrogenase
MRKTTRAHGRLAVSLGVGKAVVAGIVCMAGAAAVSGQAGQEVGWPAYGADEAGTRYSTAKQIDRSNVGQLAVAWTYRTGAMAIATRLVKKAAFEATPILVEGRLFLTTPYDQVIALDPGTGEKIWDYDPGVDLTMNRSEVTSRGVSAWRETASPNRPVACRLRIFVGTLDARLVALDGATGKPCDDFGSHGQVDLNQEAATQTEWTGGYQVTSPPAIYRDLVIVGSSIADNWRVDTGRGIVRAFDVRTGKLKWTWDPIPWAAKTTPRTGAGNAWAAFAVDSEHDLVFVPTGSAAPDYFGGIRKGDNRWANSVVALRASTGQLVWGFQVVHHDLWDYDVAAQPTLFTWKDGTPALVINSKMGHVFVLNRLTGQPLLPVQERRVPQTDVAGEETSATQPFSTISLVPEEFRAEDAWGLTADDAKWCADKVRASRNEGIFTPPSLKGTVEAPGNVGGVNWGGAAYDPSRHVMVVNTNRLVAWMKLIPRAEYAAEMKKEQDNRVFGEFGDQQPSAYGMYRTFLFSPSKTPCNAPPWGTTAAVDLFTGKIAWNVPLGTMLPGAASGSINLGGPMMTAGGLVFTSATIDPHLRGFDSESGKELWSYELPAAAQATPMTYVWKGKQYLVIAAGGHGKLGSKQGDHVIAFALP